MKVICNLFLFFCFFSLFGLSTAYQAVSVPGDTYGDKVISAEELKVSEKDFKDGRISSEELETIRLIHESYPRNIIDSAGNSPCEAYQEYLKEFQGADVDVVNKGVFVYPEA
ncbi:MAG: hypothetical protein ACYDHX_04270 [Methanothrix sp.]